MSTTLPLVSPTPTWCSRLELLRTVRTLAKVYKNAHIIAAKLCGDDPVMDRYADELKTRAETNAAQHASKKAPHYHESFGVENVPAKKGFVRDRMVYSDDPNAKSKEFGHMTPDGKWVPGQLSLVKAMGDS